MVDLAKLPVFAIMAKDPLCQARWRCREADSEILEGVEGGEAAFSGKAQCRNRKHDRRGDDKELAVHRKELAFHRSVSVPY